MTAELIQRIRDLNTPMSPLATEADSAHRRLTDIRAVLFDIYGTLLISGSGDVGTDVTTAQSTAMTAALQAARIPSQPRAGELFETIRLHQERARAAGIDFPEVDIVAVWRDLLGGPDCPVDEAGLQSLAVEFECRVNPVWPMPGAAECLAQVCDSGRVLGIVSNAQFYSPLTLEALLGKSPEQLGFAADLQFFSYESGRAKPSAFLFECAMRSLDERGIAPQQALYVGNDMLKDIAAAGSVGFATALFAGDARSLRMRQGDPRVDGITPTVTLTALAQLTDCLAED